MAGEAAIETRQAALRLLAVTMTVIIGLMVQARSAWGGPADAAALRQDRWRHYPTGPSARQGAPNVLVIMTDDVGFGAASTFGGPIETHTLGALAQSGLRYTEFHTTAMCSPTRAALLTGRNHHAVQSGAIGDLSTDEDGYTSVLPKSAATIGRVFTDAGYATAWFGKNHNTPKWENSRLGPFDRWPTGLGFQYFYGFNGAYANQFAPELVENTNLVDPPKTKGYILDHDLADHAIRWLQLTHSVQPKRPFLIYYAPGSAHMPNQAPADWIGRFRGKFDMGWDELRKQTLARQIQLGLAPPNTRLTPRPPQIPAWSSLTSTQQRVAARMMEVYAAQLAYCDDQIGRVVGAVKDLGELDNTLIVYVQGDNGGATEILDGTRNFEATFAGVGESADEVNAHLEELGGPRSLALYPVGWAWATNAPFQWGKQVASHFGGTRNGMVIAWPHHVLDAGGIRRQFHHVIDIAPTLYAAADITPPRSVDGVRQLPLDGVSMLYTLSQPTAASRHHEQYFEMLGNMAYYKDGWIASTTPRRMPWGGDAPDAPPVWELYDVAEDFSQADDLAGRSPAKLRELERDFFGAARRFDVLPIQTSFLGRFDPSLRPGKFDGLERATFHASPERYPDADFPHLGKHWSMAVTLEAPVVPADGALVVHGDRFSGWGLLVEHGRPLFLYRSSDRDADLAVIRAQTPLTAGRHVIEVQMSAAPGGAGMKAVLLVDGRIAGVSPIARPASGDVATYIGRSAPVPIADNLETPDVYGGVIDSVDLTLR
ncbi:MAG TPA: arylsulfatase [Caulobacteraceae bacterium]|jgi:arylsulfatase|nr:arylsulfatase [Caulobacteraceae bacterium]